MYLCSVVCYVFSCTHDIVHDCTCVISLSLPLHGVVHIYIVGGKKCLVCGARVAHDKWNISPRLAEQRWAHHQARLREIDEVVDFLS